jgi:hypothetical protein
MWSFTCSRRRLLASMYSFVYPLISGWPNSPRSIVYPRSLSRTASSDR